MVQASFFASYEGYFKVNASHGKYFTVLIAVKNFPKSADRFKPTYIL